MLIYKFNVLQKLKEKGMTTYYLEKKTPLSETTIQSLRKGKSISWTSLDILCGLLDCQPSDIIEYVPNKNIEETTAK